MTMSDAVRGVLVLTGVLLAGDGQAADRYPGSICRQISGGTLGFFAGTVTNLSSTSELNVMCPLPRTGQAISSAEIVVFDRHTTLDVSCTIFNETGLVTSGIGSQSLTQTSSGSATEARRLTYGAISGSQYTYATCSIPRVQNGNVSHLVNIVI